MKVYTAKEVAEQLNVGIRSVQKRCVRYGVNKTEDGFMIPQSVIDQWQEKNQKIANGHRTNNERVDNLEEEVERLSEEVERYREAIVQHQKLLRLITQRLNEVPTQEVREEIEYPDTTPMAVTKSLHPESTEKRPSMNDVNFQSSYNPNWNKDND